MFRYQRTRCEKRTYPAPEPRNRLLILVVMAALALAMAPSFAQGPWDLAADFSKTSNPNGAWSYGGKTNMSSFSLATGFADFGGDMSGWVWPIVFKNTSGAPWDDGYTYVETDMATAHPGQSGSPDPMSAYRFTSPVAAKLNVSVRFSGQFYGNANGTTTDVHVVKNGASLYDDTIAGFAGFGGGSGAWGDFERIYSDDVTVAAGDTIDFAVGANGAASGDMTGVSATITVLDTNVGTVDGVVTSNQAGNPPIAGARVEAVGTGFWVLTDASGNYSLVLPSGTYTLEFSATGFVTEQETGVVVTTGSSTLLSTILDDARGTVSGTVYADTSGNPPIAGAKVETLDGSVSTRTDANGDYSMPLYAGTYTLRASAGGFVTQEVPGVVISVGADTPTDIAMDPSTVWDTAADFSWEVNPNGVWSYGGKSSMSSFVISPTYSDFYGGGMKGWLWPVVFKNTSAGDWNDGYTHAEAGMATAHPGPPGDPMAAYRFISPVSANIKIDATFSGRYYGGAKGTTSDVHLVKNGTSLWDAVVAGYAGRDGVPAFGDSPVQTCTIQMPIAQGDIIDFAVGPYEGSSADLTGVMATITTVTDPNIGTITGIVRSDRVGNPPVAGAKVEAFVGALSLGQTLTDVNGNYWLYVPADTYTLEIGAEGFVTKQETSVVVSSGGSTTRDVTLNELRGTISGKVTANVAGSPPIAGAKVQLLDGSVSDITDANGDYSLLLFAGTHDIRISAGGYTTSDVTGVLVTVGDDTPQNVALDVSTVWDTSGDFSWETNPNGLWSYGGKSSMDAFALAGTYSDFYGGGMKGWVWPIAFKNTSASDWNDGYTHAEPGMATAHPGMPGNAAMMATYRATSPVTARVEVDVTFSGRYFGGASGTTTDVHVAKNGIAVWDGIIAGYAGRDGVPAFGTSPVQTCTMELVVVQGDTIDIIVAASDGIASADLTGVMGTITILEYITPGAPTTVAAMKSVADGTGVWSAALPVTAKFGDTFYIEEPNRNAGIRVDLPWNSVTVGTKVIVGGTVRTDAANGERYIDAEIAINQDAGSVAPVLMTNKNLGGGASGLQEGIAGASGLNNIGLLVTVVGRASLPGAGLFNIDDGAGVSVKVVLPAGAAVPASGAFVSVTGISCCEKIGGNLSRVIRSVGPVHLPAGAAGMTTSTFGGGRQIWIKSSSFVGRSVDGGSPNFVVDPAASTNSISGSYYFYRDTPSGTSVAEQLDWWAQYEVPVASVPFALAGTWTFWARTSQSVSSVAESDWVIVNGDPNDLNISNPTDAEWRAGLNLDGNTERILNNLGSFYGYNFGWFSSENSTTFRHKTFSVIDGKVAFRIYEREAGPANALIDVICWSDNDTYVPTDADLLSLTW